MIRWAVVLVALWFAGTTAAEERIISLAPHITEILFAVGAGEEIVGVIDHSDFPEAAKSIPRIGSANKFNYEAIVALNPTLVFGWDSGNGADRLERFKQLGISVYSHDPHSLEDVANSLETFGRLTGHSEEGRVAAEKFYQQLESLRADYADRGKVSVYYQIWDEPMMTVNGEHLISDVIRICGGTNIFADALPLVPKVSIESVMSRNPEVIVAAGSGSEDMSQLAGWQKWSSIPAVKNQHLYSVNADFMHRHSPRILQGASELCQVLNKAR